MTGRANGEGSLYPYRNGWAAYVWVTTPAGIKDRKYIYGQDREDVHDRWIDLQAKAKKMPIPTKNPTVADYFAYWLTEVIKPNREEGTYSAYELSGRFHIIPGIGERRIDKLTVRETQAWLNKIPGNHLEAVRREPVFTLRVYRGDSKASLLQRIKEIDWARYGGNRPCCCHLLFELREPGRDRIAAPCRPLD